MTPSMALPFLAFWVLLFVGREELGLKGIVVAVAIWIGLLVGCLLTGVPVLFMSAQALLDVALILFVFRGDIRIR
jgi:hypothetical protein